MSSAVAYFIASNYSCKSTSTLLNLMASQRNTLPTSSSAQETLLLEQPPQESYKRSRSCDDYQQIPDAPPQKIRRLDD